MSLIKVLAFPSAAAAWAYVFICNGLLSVFHVKIVKAFMVFHVVSFALISLMVSGGVLGALLAGNVLASLGGLLHVFLVLSLAAGALYAYRQLARK